MKEVKKERKVWRVLKELRLQKGYTVNYMSEKTKLSRSFYWQIENGERRLTYENAKIIASVFNLKPDDLFYNN